MCVPHVAAQVEGREEDGDGPDSFLQHIAKWMLFGVLLVHADGENLRGPRLRVRPRLRANERPYHVH